MLVAEKGKGVGQVVGAVPVLELFVTCGLGKATQPSNCKKRLVSVGVCFNSSHKAGKVNRTWTDSVCVCASAI